MVRGELGGGEEQREGLVFDPEEVQVRCVTEGKFEVVACQGMR
jgi:hypothetical protein